MVVWCHNDSVVVWYHSLPYISWKHHKVVLCVRTSSSTVLLYFWSHYTYSTVVQSVTIEVIPWCHMIVHLFGCYTFSRASVHCVRVVSTVMLCTCALNTSLCMCCAQHCQANPTMWHHMKYLYTITFCATLLPEKQSFPALVGVMKSSPCRSYEMDLEITFC